MIVLLMRNFHKLKRIAFDLYKTYPIHIHMKKNKANLGLL